ncbi:MAG: ATP-binding protein [Planctomycetota bacterium]|nr:ATP-binding protein [Planctomycetota bacterium]
MAKNTRTIRKRTHAPAQRSGEEFLALTQKLLQAANRVALRADFLRTVSDILLDFTGCDWVEIAAQQGARHFRSRAFRGAPGKFMFEQRSSRKADSPQVIRLRKTCAAGRAGKRNPAEIALPLTLGRGAFGLVRLHGRKCADIGAQDRIRFRGVAETLAVALVHRSALLNLRERVKELTCLYGIAQAISKPASSLADVLREIARLLPPAWLYPEIATARIVLDGRSCSTGGMGRGVHRMTAAIVVRGRIRGRVEIAYGERRPELDEGPFLKEERDLIDAVAREISYIVDRSEAEQERLRYEEQLRRADRLGTIGQLAAGVAHEINEPLGTVLGFAQLAQKCPGVPSQAREDLDKIITASLHAREVVRKLMAFARKVPAHKAQVDLNAIVEEGLCLLESRCAKEGIRVERTLLPGLPAVLADASQLHQVLINLVVNAIQAMPKGGTLKIGTAATADHVSLAVEDTGIGMSDDVRRRVFTPFFTTKKAGQGTGLGLPIAHSIVSSHGGRIEIHSRVGHGSRFEILLPRNGG